MKAHFLQSPAWEKFEKLEQHRVFRIDEEAFSVMAVLESTPFGNYLFCPYGPTINYQTPAECEKNFRLALEALVELARQQKAFFVRIEPPFDTISAAKLKCDFKLKKSHDINPAHTWIFDLTPSETEIFQNITKTNGRLWRNCAKRGITFRTTQNPDEIDILTSFLDQVGNQNHFIPQTKERLINQMKAGFATLYLAELNGTPIAATLVYDYDGTRYYAHVAADYEHRKLSAGALLVVQMIVDAKRAGMKTFDFWGITTSTDKNHPWYGFTQFKKSFVGQQVNYSGTWDLPIKKLRYGIYKIFRKINRLRRKIQHH